MCDISASLITSRKRSRAGETAWGPLMGSAPEVPEPARRQLGVAHGMLDVAMPEPCLQGARIVAGVRQGQAARVPEHVRVDRKRHPSALAEALDEARESSWASSGPRVLRRTDGGLAVVRAAGGARRGSRHPGSDGHSVCHACCGGHADGRRLARPGATAVAQFTGPQTVPKGDQYHGRVAMTAARFASRSHQGFDLGGGKIFARSRNWGIYDGWGSALGDYETHDTVVSDQTRELMNIYSSVSMMIVSHTSRSSSEFKVSENDAADAEAICEAVRRPTMRSVAV